MLDIDSAIPFLVEHGYVDVEQVLGGEVAVEALPRRNRNLQVRISNGSGLFIKQQEDLAPGSSQTLRAEGEFYGRHARPRSSIASMLPRLLLFEPSVPLLVLELLPAHQTLSDLHRSSTHASFPIAAWRELGRCLGEIHRELRRWQTTGRAARALLPWVTRAHEPVPGALAELSPARLEVLEIVQTSTSIAEGLDGLERLWEPDTILHGDLRASNVLVRAQAGAIEDVRLIDWELHRFGDPAWDIAGCIEALVVHWLRDMPSAEDDDPAEARPPSTFPLAVLQAASLALWEGYLASERRDDAWARAAAPKVAHFVAARMVQSALEMTSQAARLPESAVTLLQVCENVFADPARASTELLALA